MVRRIVLLKMNNLITDDSGISAGLKSKIKHIRYQAIGGRIQ